MVDKLKRSLENLEPPECPQCHIEMKWFESKLIQLEPSLVIEHQFACDSCGGTRKYRENLKAGEPPPPTKLAHARDRLARAA